MAMRTTHDLIIDEKRVADGSAKYWNAVARRILDETLPAEPVILQAFGLEKRLETKSAPNLARRRGVSLDLYSCSEAGRPFETKLWNAAIRRRGGGFVLGAACQLRAGFAALAFEFARRGITPPETRIAFAA